MNITINHTHLKDKQTFFEILMCHSICMRNRRSNKYVQEGKNWMKKLVYLKRLIEKLVNLKKLIGIVSHNVCITNLCFSKYVRKNE